MTPVELLQELTDADVALWVDGDRLRYLAGRSLAPTLRVAVAAGRAELVALLRRGVALPADVGAWPEGHIEALDERLAVMEFDGLLVSLSHSASVQRPLDLSSQWHSPRFISSMMMRGALRRPSKGERCTLACLPAIPWELSSQRRH